MIKKYFVFWFTVGFFVIGLMLIGPPVGASTNVTGDHSDVIGNHPTISPAVSSSATPHPSVAAPHPSVTVSPAANIKDIPKHNGAEVQGEQNNLNNIAPNNNHDPKTQLLENVQQKMDELKQQRADFEAKIKIQKEEMKNQIDVKKAELTTKLAKIKDTSKKATVEKINDQLVKLNLDTTDKFSKALNQLEDVLNKISERAKKDSDKGLDITEVSNAITNASAIIKTSRDAIQIQAAKIYTVKITTEANLKTDVGSVRQTLQTDLAAVKKTVTAARDVVHNSALSLGQLHGVIKESPKPSPVASVSPSSSPSSSPTAQ